MRGAFVACFGLAPDPGELERAAAAMRWHTGDPAYHAGKNMHAAVLADAADGPFVETDGARMLVVHGSEPRPLEELQRVGRRFAAVECRGEALVAARDPLGLCPLFYRELDGRLWLSTEILPLSVLAPVRPDLATLAAQLALVPDSERTGFEEIFRVLPGFLLEAGEGRTARQRRYWQVGAMVGSYRGGRVQAEEELRDRFVQAVDRSLAPAAGILLSGGIDSMSIAAAASRLDREFSAVHVVFPGLADVTEDEHARRLSAALGFRLDVIPGDLTPWDPEAHLRISVVPYLTAPSYTADTALAHLAADGVGIALDGNDGDGVLGYVGREWGELLRTGRVRRLVELSRQYGGRQVLRGVLDDVVPPGFRLRRLRRRPAPPPTYLEWTGRYFAKPLQARMRKIDHQRWQSPFGEWRARQLRQVLPATTIVNEEYELTGASHGIDMRHPFADRDLVQFLIALPAEVKSDPFLPKALLRRALASTVPPGTLERRGKAEFSGVYRRRVDAARCLQIIRDSGLELPLVDYELLFRDAEVSDSVPLVLLMCLARAHVFAAMHA